MNKKTILKVVFAIFVFALSIIFLNGCETETAEARVPTRFIEIERENIGIDYIVIYVDSRTNVEYMFEKGQYGGGLTVMLDTDGKPLIYTGE